MKFSNRIKVIVNLLKTPIITFCILLIFLILKFKFFGNGGRYSLGITKPLDWDEIDYRMIFFISGFLSFLVLIYKIFTQNRH